MINVYMFLVVLIGILLLMTIKVTIRHIKKNND
jgi:hypothetical protein